MTSNIIKLSGLTPREAITDALYRATLAYDLNNERLLKSALTKDVVFSMPAFGVELKGLDGLQPNFAHVGPLVTGHIVGNVRIELASPDARTATLSAIGLNQHIRPKDQEAHQTPPQFFIGLQYDAEARLEKDAEAGEIWKLSRWTLKPLYRLGDPSIVAP